MAKKISKKTVAKVTKKTKAPVKAVTPKAKPGAAMRKAIQADFEKGQREKIMKQAEEVRLWVQQQESALTQGAPHGVVRARAGTGKTFTLVLGVANIYRDKMLPTGSNGYTWKGPQGDKAGQFVAEAATLWGKVEMEMARLPNDGGFRKDAQGRYPRIVPSRQQQEVWDFMALSKPRRVCYVAFNNSIVEEFAEKYQWLVVALEELGVTLSFSTIHSLGNAACRKHFKLRPYTGVDKGDYKITDWLSAKWQVDLREVWKEKADTIQAVKELLALCKLTLAGTTDDDGVKFHEKTESSRWKCEPENVELDALAVHYGIDLNGNKDEVFSLVKELLNYCRDVPRDGTGKIGFNDMIWLPVVEDLPVEQYDLLLVDESQDMNRCQQELVMKAGRRIVIVGDERQAIYGFAGADTDSIDRMTKMLRDRDDREVETMYLTETRRCGKAIVQEANRFVEDFTAHEKNGEGKVTRISEDSLDWGGDSMGETKTYATPEEAMANPIYSLGENDFVLCRTNAPLVRLAFKMLKAGKRVNIQGRDIGTGLKVFIKKWNKGRKGYGGKGRGTEEINEMVSAAGEVVDFLDWLDRYQQAEIEKLQKRRNVDNEAVLTLVDKCDCLRTVCDGAFTMKEVGKNIDSLFKGKVCPVCEQAHDEQQRHCWKCKQGGRSVKLVRPAGTICSSVHRAKGMEAKRVFILRPDLMPHPKAKSDWEKVQEANLQYVAITRAIEELVYVTKGEEDGE